jgi:hypothetical protein
MMFETDRFISLMMGTTYSVPDTGYNNSSRVARPMQRLAVLVGKVIDHTQHPRSTSYSNVLETDKELIDFGTHLLENPWKHGPPPMSFSKGSPKRPEVELPVLLFYQARLLLHLPWTLRSSTHAGFEYSRSSCFEAARAIIRLFKNNRVTEHNFGENKCAPIDLIAFVAAAILCLGQFGYAPYTDNGSRSTRDEELVQSVIEGFKRMRTNIASQSIDNLKELTELKGKWSRGEPVPTKISVPYLGEVIITEKSFKTFEELRPIDMVSEIVPYESKSEAVVDLPMSQSAFVEPVVQVLDHTDQNTIPQPWTMPYSASFDSTAFPFFLPNVESGLIANSFQTYGV